MSNGECIKGFNRYRVNLRLKEDYKDAFSDNTSEEFRKISSMIQNAMGTVYRDNEDYDSVRVIALRNGSVIADLELLFKDTDTSGVSELLSAVRNNSFGDFDVDQDALTVIITGTCPSDQCPGNSTCKTLSSSTIFCPCNEGYYYDGMLCVENIVVNVVITLQEVIFTEDLKNKSSPAFIELKKNVTLELYEIFKDTPNFQEVIVLGFSNGSVKVDFRVIYRKDRVLNKKVVVAETLKKKIIDGKLGTLVVKNIDFKEPPPPPTNLKNTGVTETRIEVKWDPPKGQEYFDIEKYVVGYKTLSENEFEVKDHKSLKTLNVVLDNLDSDTYYVITVHAINDEGDGDKVKMQVKTEKSDSSTNVVLIVVVVVIVLVLVIIIIVLVVQIRIRNRNKRRREQQMAAHVGFNQRCEGAPKVDLVRMSSKQGHFENLSYDKDDEMEVGSKL